MAARTPACSSPVTRKLRADAARELKKFEESQLQVRSPESMAARGKATE